MCMGGWVGGWVGWGGALLAMCSKSDRPHPIRGYTSLHVHVIPRLHLRTTFACRLHRHTTSSVSYIRCVSIVTIVLEITRGNVQK